MPYLTMSQRVARLEQRGLHRGLGEYLRDDLVGITPEPDAVAVLKDLETSTDWGIRAVSRFWRAGDLFTSRWPRTSNAVAYVVGVASWLATRIKRR